MRSYVSLDFEQFKQKFLCYFVQKKKIRALENYGQVQDFEGKKFLPILKELIHDGILDQKEESFLNHQIEKIQIDALAWCHKTPWIKSEMRRLRREQKADVQSQFYLPLEMPKQKSIAMPGHLMGKPMPGARVVRL